MDAFLREIVVLESVALLAHPASQWNALIDEVSGNPGGTYLLDAAFKHAVAAFPTRRRLLDDSRLEGARKGLSHVFREIEVELPRQAQMFFALSAKLAPEFIEFLCES